MELNWKVIAPIAVLGMALVIFLIRRNLKDEKEVEQHFIDEAEGVETEEDEFNNQI
jgi:hypothetical protein